MEQAVPVVADCRIDRSVAANSPPVRDDDNRIPVALVVGDGAEWRIVDVLHRGWLAPRDEHALVRVVWVIDQQLAIARPAEVEHELQSHRCSRARLG